MTLCAIGATNNKFASHSGDERPTDVDEGATLHLVDTGEELIFHNGGWVQDLRIINAIRMANL